MRNIQVVLETSNVFCDLLTANKSLINYVISGVL